MQAETMVRERPILFSGPMVRAILEDQKTQTRRVPKSIVDKRRPAGTREAILRLRDDFDAEWYWPGHPDFPPVRVRNPYGQPGDRLWVRETWAQVRTVEVFSGGPGSAIEYRAGRPVLVPPAEGPCTPDRMLREWKTEPHFKVDRWRPSIFMPREHSRLTLEITDVRVERLQEITEDDARAEGVPPNWCGPLDGFDPEAHGYLPPDPEKYPDTDDWPNFTAREAFRLLWDSINAARGHGWDSNPWVWAISFRRLP